jgi:serine/threonine protein kinase
MDSNTNMTGNIGTLLWMAPEMFQSQAYTEKVDVYSYGIVLFELLTGDIPYQGENSFSLPVQVTRGLRPTIPKGLSKTWTKLMTSCWHDKPSRRPGFDKIVQTLLTLTNEPIGIVAKNSKPKDSSLAPKVNSGEHRSN